MTTSPPEAGRRRHHTAPRRHQSRQRARILDWLRRTDSHPTASEVHAALLPEMPSLSLGTVYRNLEVLVSERLVEEVHAAGGRVRYDGNPKPHHHFTCDACGAIEDLHLQAPAELARKLRRARGRTARRIRIEFFGLCEACESLASNAGTVR